MPGPGRAPAGRGGIEPGPGGRGAASRVVKGLLPAGRGVNGLLPAGRGAPGRGAAGRDGASDSAAGASGCTTGVVGGKTSSVGANTGGSGIAAGSGTTAAGAAGTGASSPTAVCLAAVFLAGFGSAAGAGGKAASTFATTGASIVDDGVLTYSPLLFNHSISCLDCSPTSLARAETRCLATNFSFGGPRSVSRKPLSVHGGTHRCWLIERSWFGSALFGVVVRGADGNVVEQCRQVERAVEPQGSRERSAALRLQDTFSRRMHVCTASGRSASRVGNQGSVDRDDAQQR